MACDQERHAARSTPPGTHVLVALGVAALVLLAAAPAGAHGDEGEMELLRAEQTGPGTVAVEVGIVYANDGHLAEDATVEATLTATDGSAVGPVALERTAEGTSVYAGTVQVPSEGIFIVDVRSTGPDARISGSVDVGADATTTTEVADDAAAEPDGTTTTTAVTPVPAVDAGDDGGSAAFLWVVVGLAVAAAVAGGVVLARRRAADDAS